MTIELLRLIEDIDQRLPPCSDSAFQIMVYATPEDLLKPIREGKLVVISRGILRQMAKAIRDGICNDAAKRKELAVREMTERSMRRCPECGCIVTEMGTTKVYWLCNHCGHYIEPIAAAKPQGE